MVTNKLVILENLFSIVEREKQKAAISVVFITPNVVYQNSIWILPGSLENVESCIPILTSPSAININGAKTSQPFHINF